MALVPASHEPVRAYFIDWPLAGEERLIDTAPDGGPRPRVTLPDAPEVLYERADWGDERTAVRYRAKSLERLA